jgi:hypothetical protein
LKNIKNRGNELKDLLQRQGITEIASSKRTHFCAEKAAIGAERIGISRIVVGRLAVPGPERSHTIRGRASPTPTPAAIGGLGRIKTLSLSCAFWQTMRLMIISGIALVKGGLAYHEEVFVQSA